MIKQPLFDKALEDTNGFLYRVLVVYAGTLEEINLLFTPESSVDGVNAALQIFNSWRRKFRYECFIGS